jgi:dihydroorotase
LVRRAKADGARITAEATPHHFTLTDAALETYDPLMKVNPPLRTSEDVDALTRGLADGTIDAIATDHAPHAVEEKDQEFSYAPPGMLGLETTLALGLTQLVEPGHLDLVRLVEALSTQPARILGLSDQGSLAIGSVANVVVFDPSVRWTVDASSLQSRSRNTPFDGRELTGRVMHTFFGGHPTVHDGKVLSGETSDRLDDRAKERV